MCPTDTCEVAVRALLGGQFQLSEGTKLISAIYNIYRCEKSTKVATMYFPVQAKIPQKFLYYPNFDFCHTKFYNLQATNRYVVCH